MCYESNQTVNKLEPDGNYLAVATFYSSYASVHGNTHVLGFTKNINTHVLGI